MTEPKLSLPDRKSIRLKDFDYSNIGGYFITICSQNMRCLFGEVENGEMKPNLFGKMVEMEWKNLETRFPQIELDVWTAMPNHFHGIVMILRRPEMVTANNPSPIRAMTSIARTSEPRVRLLLAGEDKLHPYGTEEGSLGRIMQAFKSITTVTFLKTLKESGRRSESGKLWHRNYYEHVIRNESDLAMIREYIQNNPLRWELDRFYEMR